MNDNVRHEVRITVKILIKWMLSMQQAFLVWFFFCNVLLYVHEVISNYVIFSDLLMQPFQVR